MESKRTAKVLMISDITTAVFASPLQRLTQYGCECHVATSPDDLESMLGMGPFDLVLSTRTLQGRSTSGLGGLLWRARSSLYYALGAQQDSWWLPVLRRGEECFGTPALRGNEFAAALDEMIAEIRDRSEYSRPS